MKSLPATDEREPVMRILHYRSPIDQIYDREIPEEADFEEAVSSFIRPDCLALSRTTITLRHTTYTIWYDDTCVYYGRYVASFATLDKSGNVDTIFFGDLVISAEKDGRPCSIEENCPYKDLAVLKGILIRTIRDRRELAEAFLKEK